MIAGAFIALAALCVLSQLRFLALCAARALASKAPAVPAPMRHVDVSIQIAVYREQAALPSVLDAVRALDWPTDRFETLVLDDSVGADAAATRAIVERYAAAGMRVLWLNRGDRAGFKAGALNAGMADTDAPVIAYFDADCRPRPNFLMETIGAFEDPRVACVQARWAYPNALASPLAMFQAATFGYLFRFEIALRAQLGAPAFYMGSAGLWRRDAMLDLGGWKTSPFTAEDLDLGYRAGAAGLGIVYAPALSADTDAVEDLLAFRVQQRRWARAILQVALDVARGLGSSKTGLAAKVVEATTTLAHGSTLLLLAAATVLALSQISGPSHGSLATVAEWAFLATVLAGPAFLAALYALTFRGAERARAFSLIPGLGPVASASAFSFLAGFVDLMTIRDGEFVVTPKAGQVGVVGGSETRWLASARAPILVEAGVGAWLAAGAVAAVAHGAWPAALALAAIAAAALVSAGLSERAARAHAKRLSELAAAPKPKAKAALAIPGAEPDAEAAQ